MARVLQLFRRSEISTFEQAYTYVLHRPLEPSILDDPHFSCSMKILRKAILEDKTDVPQDVCAALRHAFEYNETMLETAHALAGRMGPVSRTFEFAKKEGEAAAMTADSRVLFIGSGPYPESAMAYADAFGCVVDCLDCCPVAIAVSSKFVRTGQVICGRGESYDLTPYTHIAVAILVKDKAKVIENCLLHKGRTLIIRTVDAPGDAIYEPVGPDVLSRLARKAVVRGQTIMHSIIAVT